jgi:hypothetical protein
MVAASLLVLFDTQKHAEAETMLLPSSPLSEILHQHLLWCGFLARMSTTLSILRLCCACLHRYQYSCTQLDYNRTDAGVCVCVSVSSKSIRKSTMSSPVSSPLAIKLTTRWALSLSTMFPSKLSKIRRPLFMLCFSERPCSSGYVTV